MSQAVVDLVMKKASNLFGKPNKEGWSTTIGPDGTVMLWFHHEW